MNNYLKVRRKEVGLTQKQVADFVGVAEATVSRWESGDIANMRRDRIARLAEALKTTPDFIMTGSEAAVAISPTKQKLLDVALELSDEEALQLLSIIEKVKSGI